MMSVKISIALASRGNRTQEQGGQLSAGIHLREEEGKEPGICFYLTDMECSSWPDKSPFGVVWLNWGDTPGKHHQEPWD